MNEQNSQIILRVFFSGILVLILVIFPIISHAGDGDDLVKAAATGNLSKVRTLFEKETNVDHQNNVGVTPLMKASYMGYVEIVQALLAQGAKIDHQDSYGFTALILASRNGHDEVVEILLAKGVRVNHQNKKGSTALDHAKTQQIKKLLKVAGSTK